MKYLSGYVWKAPEVACVEEKMHRDSSILLQQISYGKCNVVLACVCGGDVIGGYVTGGLKAWLAKRGKELFMNKVEDNGIKKELERELTRLDKEAGRYYNRKNEGRLQMQLSGILIADQDCWLMQSGESGIMLLNRRFQRTHCKRIGKESAASIQVIGAGIQKCVGVLLGSNSFLQHVSGEALAQCLAPHEIQKEGQIDRRLAELAEESRRRGYQQECSAVYVRSM